MKKIITIAAAAGWAATVATAAVDVTMDFASAYVFRGVTFNDGFVFQPGIEASGLGLPEEYGAIAVGAWGNYDIDDYDENLPSSAFSEVDWYASYSLPTLVEGLDLYVGYTEYTYPGVAYSDLPSDSEVGIGAGYEISGVALGLDYYQGIGGGISGSAYIEAAAGYGMDFTEELSGSVDGTIAYADIDGGESGFANYTLGASVGYALGEVWSVGASLTYIGQGDDKVLPDAVYSPGGVLVSSGYDVEVVGVLSIGASL